MHQHPFVQCRYPSLFAVQQLQANVNALGIIGDQLSGNLDRRAQSEFADVNNPCVERERGFVGRLHVALANANKGTEGIHRVIGGH